MSLFVKTFQVLRRTVCYRGYILSYVEGPRGLNSVSYSDISLGRSASANAAPTRESSVI